MLKRRKGHFRVPTSSESVLTGTTSVSNLTAQAITVGEMTTIVKICGKRTHSGNRPSL